MQDGSCLWRAAALGALLIGLSHSHATAQDYFLPPVPPSNDGYGEATSTSYNTMMFELEQRLAALEDKDKEKKDKEKKDKEEEACKEIDILTKPTMKVFGRVHFDYWGFPEESPLANFLSSSGDPAEGPPDFIGFRRLRIGVSGKVNETMEYKMEMEFASPDNLAFKDAYLGWNELPLLHTVLVGNQKRPYGLDHLNSSRYNVFLERPFHVEAFNQDARRLGIQSYGLSEDERWNWRFGGFIMDDLQNPGFQYTDNYQPEFAARLANTIWYDDTSDGRGYAHWAVSTSAAFPGGGPDARFRTRPEARTQNRWFDTGPIFRGQTYQLLGFEGVVNVGRLSAVGEYQNAWVQRTANSDLNFGGGYVYVAYWLTEDYSPWDRKTGTLDRTEPLENAFAVRTCEGGRANGWGAWQVGARYSYGDFSDNDILGGIGESFTLGLNWWWNPRGRIQFNYIHGDISRRDPATTGGAALPVGVGTSGDYDAYGVRLMVDF